MKESDRVAQRKQHDQEQENFEASLHPLQAEPKRTGGFIGPGDILCRQRQHHHGQEGRHDAHQHGDLEGVPGKVQRALFSQPDDEGSQPKAHEGAGGVTGAMDAEGQPALLLVDAIRHQRIARRRANAFAHPVGKPDAEHPTPGVREIEEGLRDGGQSVPGDCQPFPVAKLIRKGAGIYFGQAGSGFGNAVDQADDGGAHAQHVGQEQRDEVEDHLGGDVGEEGRGRYDPDIERQISQLVFLFGHAPPGPFTPRMQTGAGS